MPVWGEVFKQQIASSPTQQAEIRATILSIVKLGDRVPMVDVEKAVLIGARTLDPRRLEPRRIR
mgnify:CR=1 FL=1